MTASDQANINIGHRMTPLQGAVYAVVLMTVIFGFTALCAMLHIVMVNVGFLFPLYWAALKGRAWPEFMPALAGAAGGVAMAFVVWYLPPFGLWGFLLLMALILAAVFCLFVGYVTVLINLSFMLFLTVGCIPPIQRAHPFVDMEEAVLLGAGVSALLNLIFIKVMARLAGHEAAAS